MRSSAPVAFEPDDFPPEHWYLSDGFNMPISTGSQRREDAVQQTFEAHIARANLDASIHANVALRWDRSRPSIGVDPDVMWVAPRLPAGLRSVLTWEPGVRPPRVAVEVVSKETAHKDYNTGPAKYAASGTRELWVFDPEGFGRTDAGEGPWALQVWRRQRGRFVRVYAGDGPARSETLDAWIIIVGDLLRVADDPEGTRLWPTTAEERDAARALAAQEVAARAAAEARAAQEAAARAAAEARAAQEAAACAAAEARAAQEAAARAAAEARVKELEALLAKRRDG